MQELPATSAAGQEPERDQSPRQTPQAPFPPWSNVSAPLLALCLAAIFVWRTLFSAWVNLLPDECSYWAWSRHLDWSYFDNSGMVAYLIRVSTELFAVSTPFSVRFPFLILSGFSAFLLYRVSVDLFGNRTRALLAVVSMNLVPMALLGGSAAIHDNALVFFWTACLWAASRFVKTGDRYWFYCMGIAAGLAIQSKYTGVLVLPSILIFLLWNRPYRGWLLRKEPWVGACVAALFALPILWWNIVHHWASLYHVLLIGTGSPAVSARILDGLGYHLAQILLISPLLYALIVVCLFAALAGNLSRPQPEDTLLLAFSLPLFLFGAMAFKGHVEANWAFMGYGSAFILATEFVSRAWTNGPKGVWRMFGSGFSKWAVILAVGPVILVALHAWIGLLPASAEKSLEKADRIIWETRGWGGLGKHVAGLVREGDVVGADSYQLCALLEFNIPGNPRVRYLAPWKRPTQFDVWEPTFDNLAGKNILFVSSRPLEPSSTVMTTIYDNFARVDPLPDYEVMYHRTPVRSVHVCRGYDFNPFSPRRLGPRSLLYRDQ